MAPGRRQTPARQAPCSWRRERDGNSRATRLARTQKLGAQRGPGKFNSYSHDFVLKVGSGKAEFLVTREEYRIVAPGKALKAVMKIDFYRLALRLDLLRGAGAWKSFFGDEVSR